MRATFLRLMMAVALAGLAAGAAATWGQEAREEWPGEAGVRRRIAALRAEIAHHDRLFFQAAAPEISDFAYDQLKSELLELEQTFPGVARELPDPSPLGDDRTGLFPTWKHRVPMLSLDKTYRETELRAFVARLARQLGPSEPDFVVEPKIDGVAISAIYEKGRLVRAVTRGNGREGDDITAHARRIRSLPGNLRRAAPDGTPNPIPEMVEVRGEIHVTFTEFNRINRDREAADEAPFAHPRNFVAGAIRRLDAMAPDEPGLDVVFFGWGAWEPASASPVTQHEFHAQVRAWGLPGLAKFRRARGADAVWAEVQACGRFRDELGFPVDGAVVKLDEVAARRRIGETDRAPRWAMAYKFGPERGETRLQGITVQVGRTGLLTPVAELAPVELAGSIVTRATLYNRRAVERLDLRVGDLVVVEKAGGIIPVITGVDQSGRPAESRRYEFPSSCPACGTAVAQLGGEAAVRCPNAACPAQVRRRLLHFASRDCADIDGLGPATIEALVARGVVTTVADLYRLRPEDLAAAGRGGGAAADRVAAAIERSKHADLWRIIHGLSIPHVGAAAARNLSRRFGSLDALAAAGREDLEAAAGSAAADSIVVFFREARNRAMVAALAGAGVGPAAPAKPGPP